jgi:hypothetical protein
LAMSAVEAETPIHFALFNTQRNEKAFTIGHATGFRQFFQPARQTIRNLWFWDVGLLVSVINGARFTVG